jgi:outer membrane protein assembly factor BamB
VAAEENIWPQFRGINSSGISDVNAKPPLFFGAEKNVKWKIALPVGHSSPCIWQDNIFLTGFIEEKKELQTICIDRHMGKIKWRRSIHPDKIEKCHQVSNPAAPTPATDGERVYVYFGSYGLLCYDMNGNLLWENKMPLAKTWYGASTSPIATEEMLILGRDIRDDCHLLAFNKTTGDTIWQVDLPKVGKHMDTSSYSTPLVVSDQVIMHRNWEISAYAIQDGSRLWWLPAPTNGNSTPVVVQNTLYVSLWQELGEKERRGDIPDFATMLSQNDTDADGLISKEEIPDDMLFFSRPEAVDINRTTWYLKRLYRYFDENEDGSIDKEEWQKTVDMIASFYQDSGLMALQLGDTGELPVSKMLWKVTGKVPEAPSPIYYQSRTYMIKNGGIITCVDAGNGKILYRARLGAQGSYYASPIAANGNIYIPSAQGSIIVIKAGDQLDILARNELGEQILASPAVIGNILYVRTTENLYAFAE